MEWLDTIGLSNLSGISRQKAHSALARSLSHPGGTWRGSALTVRTVRGRGGRSGLRYEVLVSSLPLDLQERFNAAQRHAAGPLEPVAASSAEREWWHLLLRPALVHPKRSQERGAAITAILSRPLTDWTGKEIAPSRRTLERQIAAYEQHGLMGLARHHRQDKGKPRVIVSQAWDSAAPLNDDRKAQIAGRLREYIRSLYKADTSMKLIQALASDKLADLTAKADFRSVTEELRAMCQVPRAFIEAEKVFRKVAIFKKDRKAHEDARPRISRHRGGLDPMDVVFGDVHPLDIVMFREDGSRAHPRAIAWLDAATNRLRADIVLLDQNEGVRQAHLYRSFINMTQDPAWGVPKRLYVDNGKEYGFAAFLDDMLKLVARGVMLKAGYSGEPEREGGITKARPYNAQGKPIEGMFRTLEQTYFRTIPGWTAGDRLNSKTSTVGKPTEPFTGTLDDLRQILQSFLDTCSMLPQRGATGGKSPRAIYEKALAAGWQRVAVDPDELRTVFCTQETRLVRQGRISFGGNTWTCDELHTYLGAKVTLCIPKYEDAARIPLLDEAGDLLGFAVPDRDYALMDPAGARESSRRDRAHKRAVRQLDRAAPDIDVNAEVMKFAAKASPMPAAPVAGTITLSQRAADIAHGLAEDADERRDKKRLAAERDAEKRIQIQDSLLRQLRQAGGKA